MAPRKRLWRPAGVTSGELVQVYQPEETLSLFVEEALKLSHPPRCAAVSDGVSGLRLEAQEGFLPGATVPALTSPGSLYGAFQATRLHHSF